jgi:ribosomal protein S14
MSKASKHSKPSAPVPKISPAQIRREKWISRVYAFAAFCLAALAVLVLTDTATVFPETLLMLGIVAAGTAAWAMQAKRKCPRCGKPYGYGIRIVNANVCRHCGADFPRWRPGIKEQQDDGRD